MPTFAFSPKTYADGEVGFESDFDLIKSDLETALNVTRLDADNVQDGGVPGSAIIAGSVTTAKIADASITPDKISSDSSVDANRAVGTTQIVDGDIETAAFDSDAVTSAKLGSTNYATDAFASVSYIASSEEIIESCSLTVSSGAVKDVWIIIVPSNTGSAPISIPGTDTGILRLKRGSTTIGSWLFTEVNGEISTPQFLMALDTGPAVGANTYSVTYEGPDNITIGGFRLYAIERYG